MTDAAIIALTNKLTARKKETKNFLKMIEESDVSSKVAATKDFSPQETTYYQVVGEWIVLSTEEGIPHGTQEGDAEVFNTIEEARVCFQKWIDEQFDEDEPYENIRIESYTKDEWEYPVDLETIECWSQEEDHRFQCYKADRAAAEHFQARN